MDCFIAILGAVETSIREPIFRRTLRLKFNISNLLNKNLSEADTGGGSYITGFMHLQNSRSSCFAVLKPFMCEGALRHVTTRELYLNNLRAVGPIYEKEQKIVEDETEQKTRQQNKTKGSKQGK